MTYKIELFSGSKLEDLEERVNSFIDELEYEVIDIKISSATLGPEYASPINHCIMIIYDYKRLGEL